MLEAGQTIKGVVLDMLKWGPRNYNRAKRKFRHRQGVMKGGCPEGLCTICDEVQYAKEMGEVEVEEEVEEGAEEKEKEKE